MKRVIMIIFWAAALTGQAGCDDEPTSPALAPDPVASDLVEAGAGDGPVWNERWQERLEVNGHHWVPCAAGGDGEWVHFEGVILVTGQWLATGDRYSYRLHIKPQRMYGTGEETGTLYHDVGQLNEHFLGGDAGGTTMMVDEVYRMIARGQADDFVYRFRLRVQYTPEGEPVVDWLDQSIACR